MKKITIILLYLSTTFTTSFSQEYKFLNEILLKNDQDSLLLVENYITDYYTKTENFDEDNFRQWWIEMPGITAPSIEVFFKNFNLESVRLQLESNKIDSIIDFKKINPRFKRIKREDIKDIKQQIMNETNLYYEDYLKNSFINISKPVFNKSNDWAMFLMFSENPFINANSGGQLYIYKKFKCKWNLYHKFHLWLN